MAQDRPKTAPRRPQDGPKTAPSRISWRSYVSLIFASPKRLPKTPSGRPPDLPRPPQGPPKTLPDPPETLPRLHQDPPRTPQDLPRAPQDPPNHPKSPILRGPGEPKTLIFLRFSNVFGHLVFLPSDGPRWPQTSHHLAPSASPSWAVHREASRIGPRRVAFRFLRSSFSYAAPLGGGSPSPPPPPTGRAVRRRPAADPLAASSARLPKTT